MEREVIKDFIAYLKVHPTEASELAKALVSSLAVEPEKPKRNEWVSTSKAARILNVSRYWMIAHREQFDVLPIKTRTRVAYKYNADTLLERYDMFIRRLAL